MSIYKILSFKISNVLYFTTIYSFLSYGKRSKIELKNFVNFPKEDNKLKELSMAFSSDKNFTIKQKFQISILGKQIHLKKIDKVGLAKDTGKARNK